MAGHFYVPRIEFIESSTEGPGVSTIVTRGTLPVSIEQAWKTVGDFAGIHRWHPLIEGCDADGSEVGALRTIYFSDREVVERLDELDAENHVIQYSVVKSTRPQTIGLTGRIELGRVSDEETSLVWTTTPPDLPGAAILVPGLIQYYADRVGHLRDALTG